MKKLLALMLLLSLTAVSCNKSDGGSSSEEVSVTGPIVGANPTPTPTVTPTPKPTPTPTTTPKPDPTPGPISNVPAQALTFKTNVSYLTGFDSSDQAKYDKAVLLVKKVVATEAFRNAILNHTYGGVKQFVQNNGLSNAQVYQTILDAAEKLTPSKNNTLDVGVKLYYENSTVVGYTSPSYSYVNVNTKYFDTYAINSVASNLFHEWLHKVGYGHDSDSTSRRPYSIPYAVGSILRKIGTNFI